MHSKNEALGFSIVLCTFNGVSRLATTLTHIAALNVPSGCAVELVLVNNASTDNTTNFALTTWEVLGEPFALRLLDEPRPGKGYAVETGYDAAAFTYILTVDDDNWLDKNYLVEAVSLFTAYPGVGVLQGRSEGVFESPPPAWVHELKQYFIVGSPIEQPGYFPKNNFFVWGAGMIIRRADWVYLREFGFSFSTSKLSGKAAGEDNETVIALLILGRKIYYSDKLVYQHYIPESRFNWSSIKRNFEVFGYVAHYFFIYALIVDGFTNGYQISPQLLLARKRLTLSTKFSSFTIKQHASYWLKPQEQAYQLELTRRYSECKWFFKLFRNSMKDVSRIQSWMVPLLNAHPDNFQWPNKEF